MVRKAHSPSMLGYLLAALAGLLAGIALGALGSPGRSGASRIDWPVRAVAPSPDPRP